MLSMTGYGRGEYKENGVEITVELKTVNNRYLDVSIKSPRVFVSSEEAVRSVIREKMTRGHIDVYINLSDKREQKRSLYLDEGIAKAYVATAKKLKELFPEAVDDITLTSIMRYPDAVRSEDISSDDGELLTGMNKALLSALDNLNVMRAKEGEKLKADMLKRVDYIEKLVKSIQVKAPEVAENYKSKLRSKIEKALECAEYDEQRLLTEVTIFADKSNIDEELTRLFSHVAQFREISETSLVGRKLDFLIQEFNRETNTICSKSNDLEITRLGLEIKNEIEKIREQVQNVE